MENQEEKKTTIDVNQPIDKMEIGNDVPQIESATCKIVDYRIEDVEKDGKKIGDKLVLLLKHPQVSDREIEVSGVKYLAKGDKIKSSGLWVKVDKDGKIAFNSALATMLRYLSVKSIYLLKEMEVNTVTDDNGYLVIKAY